MPKNYPEINRRQFMAALQPYFSEAEMEQIEAAYFSTQI